MKGRDSQQVQCLDIVLFLQQLLEQFDGFVKTIALHVLFAFLDLLAHRRVMFGFLVAVFDVGQRLIPEN